MGVHYILHLLLSFLSLRFSLEKPYMTIVSPWKAPRGDNIHLKIILGWRHVYQDIEGCRIKWHQGLTRSGFYYSISLCLKTQEKEVANELVLIPMGEKASFETKKKKSLKA